MLLLAVAALITAAVLPWPGGVSGVLGGFGMSASVLLGHSPGDAHHGFGRTFLLFLVFVTFVFAAVLLTALGALPRGPLGGRDAGRTARPRVRRLPGPPRHQRGERAVLRRGRVPAAHVPEHPARA